MGPGEGPPAATSADRPAATPNPPSVSVATDLLSPERRAQSLLHLAAPPHTSPSHMSAPAEPRGLKSSSSSPSLVDLEQERSASVPRRGLLEPGRFWFSGYTRPALSRPDVLDFCDDCDSWSQISMDSTATDYSQKSANRDPVSANLAPRVTDPARPVLPPGGQTDTTYKRPMILQWLTRNQTEFTGACADSGDRQKPAGDDAGGNKKHCVTTATKRADIARRMRELNAGAPQNW